MRVFPLAWRGLAITVVLAMVSMTGAHADDPTAGELQVRLVQSRQHLNQLYAQSAVASERLNGATYELTQAKAKLKHDRSRLARARTQLAKQQDAVAELTVDQMMSGSSMSKLTTLLVGDGPQELLERASAWASTDEAMNARLDALEARRVVHDAAAREAALAVAAQRAAAQRQKAARAAIRETIARAEAAVAATADERRSLLRQLAQRQGTTIAAVTRQQDTIDQRIDQAGPDLPAPEPPIPADPRPGPTQPSPPPTTTKPEPPPVEPPPASGSNVEKAIAYARAQLGEPYAWGGAGPSKWDCSGLTMRAWQAAGVNLPHYAGSQYAQTTKVPVSKIKRGDLLFWSNGGPSSIYHVAIYLGGGEMIQAPRPGRNVEIVPLSYWIKPDLASRPG